MTPDAYRDPLEAEPDFENLYEQGEAEALAMTPRMAYWLWNSSIYLANT